MPQFTRNGCCRTRVVRICSCEIGFCCDAVRQRSRGPVESDSPRVAANRWGVGPVRILGAGGYRNVKGRVARWFTGRGSGR
jgi:hypothetical protein